MDILNKEQLTFKEIEQTIYALCCRAARELTIELLKVIDEKLHGERDKTKYRDKGLRQTTIKTVYGEVEYSRHVYITKDENGRNASVYLLNQELGMDTIGFISTNLAGIITDAVADVAFRKTATHVSNTTVQVISHSGVWNVVQALGEKLAKEEQTLINEFHSEQPRGEKEVSEIGRAHV